MRSRKVTRWYCGHCNKGKLQRPAMERHEKTCTLNPDRNCTPCESGGLNGKDLPELIAFAKANATAEGMLPKSFVAEITLLADGCPDCVLAAARLSKVHFEDFYYTTENKEFWRTHDRYEAAEHAGIVGYVS